MKYLTTALIILGAIFFWLFYETIVIALVYAGYVLAVFLFVAGIFVFSFAKERYLIMQADRIERQKHAHVLTICENGETWVRDTDKNATWRNLTGTPALYVNGQQSDPKEWEIELYRQRIAAMSKAPKTIMGQAELLPAITQPIELLPALDTVQRCLIVGVTDVGKTTLMKWLVYRRLQTSKVIVIDPHAYPDKWQGCYVIGRGRNYAEIGIALDGLLKLMDKRYNEIGKGLVSEGSHSRVTILIDEWRAIVRYLGDSASDAIRALLTESRKAAFSIFVASQSDRAKPLGLEGEYDLKDGFAVVRLTLVNGKRQATLDMGNGEKEATLPGAYPENGKVIQGDSFELDLSPVENEPTEQEQQILNLHSQGESLSEICRQVFGSKGGKQASQVKQVIEQFS